MIIRSNTIINSLGVFDIKKSINVVKPRLIKLKEVPNYYNKYIRKIFKYSIKITFLIEVCMRVHVCMVNYNKMISVFLFSYTGIYQN